MIFPVIRNCLYL